MTIVIDHERYGERQTFDGIYEAQATIRRCGPAFATTTLQQWHGDVTDETGEAVGRDTAHDAVRCHFCGDSIATVAEAIDADWIPSFWEGDDEVAEPVCPKCQEEHIEADTDGELVRVTD